MVRAEKSCPLMQKQVQFTATFSKQLLATDNQISMAIPEIWRKNVWKKVKQKSKWTQMVLFKIVIYIKSARIRKKSPTKEIQDSYSWWFQPHCKNIISSNWIMNPPKNRGENHQKSLPNPQDS